MCVAAGRCAEKRADSGRKKEKGIKASQATTTIVEQEVPEVRDSGARPASDMRLWLQVFGPMIGSRAIFLLNELALFSQPVNFQFEFGNRCQQQVLIGTWAEMFFRDLHQ